MKRTLVLLLIFKSILVFSQDFETVDIDNNTYFVIPEKYDSENDGVYLSSWKFEKLTFQDGLYIAFYDDNKSILFKGQIVSGKENGKWIHYYKTGEIKSIHNYNLGIQNGKSIYYSMPSYKFRIKHPDSTYYYKSEEHFFKNGLEDGTMTMWGKDGIILRQGKYNNGIKEGTWKWFHLNGNISQISTYQNGFHIGNFKSWYENGTIEKNWFFKEFLTDNDFENHKKLKTYSFPLSLGLPINTWSEYYSNGKLKFQYSFNNHQKNGEEIEWDEFGKIKSIQKYQYGYSVQEISENCEICGTYYGKNSTITFFGNINYILSYGLHGETINGKWKKTNSIISLMEKDKNNFKKVFELKNGKIYYIKNTEFGSFEKVNF